MAQAWAKLLMSIPEYEDALLVQQGYPARFVTLPKGTQKHRVLSRKGVPDELRGKEFTRACWVDRDTGLPVFCET